MFYVGVIVNFLIDQCKIKQLIVLRPCIFIYIYDERVCVSAYRTHSLTIKYKVPTTYLQIENFLMKKDF